MPEPTRYYTVTQEREVKVRAGDPAEAVQLGNAAFSGEIEADSLSKDYILSPVRNRDIAAREDY